MADIKLNFSSQWPNIQVAKVIENPSQAGEATSFPYQRRIKHNLGFPPLTLIMGGSSEDSLDAIDVDDTYVYLSEWQTTDNNSIVVVYNLDISEDYDYAQYGSEIGDVLQDTSGGQLDLRKFLLHSRAVSPMVLSVKTHTYNKGSVAGLNFTYTHPLNYPIFNFGYIRMALDSGALKDGVWKGVPLAGQAWPVMPTDGFTSTLESTVRNGTYTGGTTWVPGTGDLAGDKGSIITLRNPAVVSSNTVSVTI